jgi:hypothetical protein
MTAKSEGNGNSNSKGNATATAKRDPSRGFRVTSDRNGGSCGNNIITEQRKSNASDGIR